MPHEGVGAVPNEATITRRAGAILVEQSEEWAAQHVRYMILEAIEPVRDDPFVILSPVPGASTTRTDTGYRYAPGATPLHETRFGQGSGYV